MSACGGRLIEQYPVIVLESRLPQTTGRIHLMAADREWDEVPFHIYVKAYHCTLNFQYTVINYVHVVLN